MTDAAFDHWATDTVASLIILSVNESIPEPVRDVLELMVETAPVEVQKAGALLVMSTVSGTGGPN